jgi:hypothetical protein
MSLNCRPFLEHKDPSVEREKEDIHALLGEHFIVVSADDKINVTKTLLQGRAGQSRFSRNFVFNLRIKET